jgi:translation initiation factor 6
LGIHILDVYRSPNIGIFLKANDKYLLVPKGLAPTKSQKLREALGVSLCHASLAGSRLLGPLAVMNNTGALVSRLAEDHEIKEIAIVTGLNVARLESKYTAVGNLIAANDRGAIVSPIIDQRSLVQVRDILGAEPLRMAFHEYAQVGAMMTATNKGAAVYPKLSEEEVAMISNVLQAEAYPTSVNGGVPFVSAGLVANSANAIVGNLTTGPELMFLTRALRV